MILLDTHIWVWWVSQQGQLTPKIEQTIQDQQATGLGVSISGKAEKSSWACRQGC